MTKIAIRRAARPWRARRRGRALALAAATLAVAGAGVAWGGELPSQLSSNWAGWVVTAGGRGAGRDRHFTDVSASWVAPVARCTPGRRTYAAFWVGLGGYSSTSRALEQIGTEADCSSLGQVFYYAWYELVPGPAVTIARLPIAPGDEIAARVHVSSDTVTLELTDLTARSRPFKVTRAMRSPRPDTSAAEWIAEAPSSCTSRGRCTALALTDFGAVTFSAASASAIGSAGTHSGPICDPAWRQYGMIVLQSGATRGSAADSRIVAEPTVLSGDGRSFGVAYGPTGSSGPTPACSPTGPSGVTGTSGTTGTTGATGASGSSGASGPTGANGTGGAIA